MPSNMPSPMSTKINLERKRRKCTMRPTAARMCWRSPCGYWKNVVGGITPVPLPVPRPAGPHCGQLICDVWLVLLISCVACALAQQAASSPSGYITSAALGISLSAGTQCSCRPMTLYLLSCTTSSSRSSANVGHNQSTCPTS